jgi:hypothetical protein
MRICREVLLRQVVSEASGDDMEKDPLKGYLIIQLGPKSICIETCAQGLQFPPFQSWDTVTPVILPVKELVGSDQAQGMPGMAKQVVHEGNACSAKSGIS